jgi:hypothetical protein
MGNGIAVNAGTQKMTLKNGSVAIWTIIILQ